MPPKKKSKEEKIFYGVMFGAAGLAVLYVLIHFFVCYEEVGPDLANTLTATIIHMQTEPFDFFPLPVGKLALAILLIVLIIMLYMTEESRKKRMMPGKEEGSAKWNDNLKKYNKEFTSPFGKEANTGEDNLIFSNEVFMSMSGRKTMRNCNILVVGGSGSGKSRFFVKPNLLQANCSYVVTDPKGELLETQGAFLEKMGYEVRIFNLVEMQYSHHYNPFNYIRNDEGVLMMINCLISNTTPQGSSKGDPFWEKSETALLLAISYYLIYEVRPADRNFTNVMRLLLKAEVKEDQENFKSTLDCLFEELEERDPSHIAVRYYKIFKMGAGKTLKSILISCSVRLATFNLKAVQDLTNNDSIDLKSIGDKKTALFVVIPSADSTFNYLVSMMYSQLFETLYFHAENECKGKRLPVHVRFLLDEFANIGTIPDFEKKLATMRAYEISCSIILQNLAQLKTMYKDAWESITGNCDSFLFLGGQEQTTLEYVSKKLGKRTILVKNNSKSKGGRGSTTEGINAKGRDLMSPDEIARMNNKNCIVFIRGLFPFFCTKYDYPKHKNYKLTGDAKDEQLYDYRHVEKFEIKQPVSNKPVRSRSHIQKTAVRHNSVPHKPTQIRDRSMNGHKNMEIQPMTAAVAKDIIVEDNLDKTLESLNIVATFRADHEFSNAENFTSTFLDDLDETLKNMGLETEEPKLPAIKPAINVSKEPKEEPKEEIIEEPEEPDFSEFGIPDDFEDPDVPDEFLDFSEDNY